MSTHDAGRRRLLRSGLLSLLLLPWSASWLRISLADEPLVSARDFARLSQYLTGVQHLDHALLRDLLYELQEEPWGMEHLRRVMEKLLPSDADAWSLLQPIDLGLLDDAERWFVQHLLVSWMTGIYFHARGNRTLSYRHALMHEALRDIRPIPGECERPFGHWRHPPARYG